MEQVTNWYIVLAELGVDDAKGKAALAADLGYNAPRKTKIAEDIQSTGARTLTEFFDRAARDRKSDRMLSRFLGYSQPYLSRLHKLADSIRELRK